MNSLLNALNADQEQMQAWRHHLHRHPEVAFDEHNTARYIAELLRSWGYAVTEGVGKTGVVASLTVGDSPKAIGLRADTDALAVQEMSDRDHKSAIPGKSHTCGHDGHSAMLLGAARYLAEKKSFNGTVHLIFQPAEEVMGGAPAMIADGLF
ncbi:MAG: amidohydrolase, partial [Aquabacterium sp.]|nr:amidohydrolase [Aquabacterium sp.]